MARASLGRLVFLFYRFPLGAAPACSRVGQVAHLKINVFLSSSLLFFSFVLFLSVLAVWHTQSQVRVTTDSLCEEFEDWRLDV